MVTESLRSLARLTLTEATDARGWRDARDPKPLLDYLKAQPAGPRARLLHVNPGRRKARHFAAVCCRRVEPLFKFPRLSDLLGLVEDYADGRIGLEELIVAAAAARAEVGAEVAGPSHLWDRVAREAHRLAPDYHLMRTTPPDRLAHAAGLLAADGNTAEAVDCWQRTAEAAANAGGDLTAELAFQADLLRDLFGNPFVPVAIDPGWRTGAVLALAGSAAESGDYGVLPILADALQEAGCEDAEVLGHCRGGGTHAPGCWVVEAVLGLS